MYQMNDIHYAIKKNNTTFATLKYKASSL